MHRFFKQRRKRDLLKKAGGSLFGADRHPICVVAVTVQVVGEICAHGVGLRKDAGQAGSQKFGIRFLGGPDFQHAIRQKHTVRRGIGLFGSGKIPPDDCRVDFSERLEIGTDRMAVKGGKRGAFCVGDAVLERRMTQKERLSGGRNCNFNLPIFKAERFCGKDADEQIGEQPDLTFRFCLEAGNSILLFFWNTLQQCVI